MRNRLLARLAFGLLLTELLLVLVSWLLSAMPTVEVRSLLTGEGVRWLISRMCDCIASPMLAWILFAGILFVQKFPSLLLIGIILFALTTLFSFITLPVEINASKRALVWLNTHNITTPDTHGYAESALRSAAYTYVISALTSLATLMYYLMIYLGNRD